jgi:thermitase
MSHVTTVRAPLLPLYLERLCEQGTRSLLARERRRAGKAFLAGTTLMRITALAAALVLASAVALLGGGALAPLHPADAQTPPEGFVPGEVLVSFEPGATGQERAEAHRQNDAEVEEVIPDIGVRVVDVPVGRERSAVAAYERNPNVSYAELNGVVRPADHGDPHDARIGEQWQYNNTGQTGGKPDADIDAFEAWGVTRGSDAVEIAIVDTGIDLDHEDLKDKIVVEKSYNVTRSKTLNDKYGHGTHVAGSAAAATDNGTGVAGTCPNCRLYNVKVVGDSGSGNVGGLAKGITWAANNGAEVINMSLGSKSGSRALKDAVDHAWVEGAVLVAAAGNHGGKAPFYPAYYDRVIAVAATDQNDARARFSNYGGWVDLAAPGKSILSTAPNHPSVMWGKRPKTYGTISGTSMAAPHVAGVAGLVSSTALCPVGDNDCVRDRIETTADEIGRTSEFWAHGRVNAYESVFSTPATPAPGG